MTRILSVIGVILLIASATGLYKLKYEVQRLDRQARALQNSINSERQSIRVLDAEWTYLNQPQRIQALADRFLQLKPVEPNQIASIENIPLRGAAPRIAGSQVPGEHLAVGRTTRKTVIAPTLATMQAADLAAADLGDDR